MKLARSLFAFRSWPFSPSMRSDRCSTLSRRLLSVSTTLRSITPAPTTTPNTSARKIANREARWNRKLIISSKEVFQRDPEAAHEHVDRLGDDTDHHHREDRGPDEEHHVETPHTPFVETAHTLRVDERGSEPEPGE